MLTMFAVDKLLETITKPKQKSPTRKLQRSPRIYGYEREDDYPGMSLELKEPLLSSRVEVDYDQGKNNTTKGVVEVSNKSNKISSNNNNTNVRVKVLLTKEEAAKMLAKCKGEGALDFKDVVNELMKLPTQRINVVSSTFSPSNDLELATIAEEEEEEEEDEKYAEYYKKNI